jgi:hypothetical protein
LLLDKVNMVKIQELEKYFDILTHDNSAYSSNHPLANDDKRFALYNELKEKMFNLVAGLGKVSASLDNSYANYISLLKQLGYSFGQLSNMDNSDLDYCIRTVTVDGMVKKKDYGNKITSGDEALFCLIEELMGLFFEDGEEVVKVTKEAMEELKHKKTLKKNEDEERKNNIIFMLQMYGEVELDLIDAKAGIIAKDKKMIEVLRQLKVGLGKELINVAIQKSGSKPKSKGIRSIISKGKSHGSAPETGRT